MLIETVKTCTNSSVIRIGDCFSETGSEVSRFEGNFSEMAGNSTSDAGIGVAHLLIKSLFLSSADKGYHCSLMIGAFCCAWQKFRVCLKYFVQLELLQILLPLWTFSSNSNSSWQEGLYTWPFFSYPKKGWRREWRKSCGLNDMIPQFYPHSYQYFI